ncbi:MAG: two-component sensor histidine kinase, partial [Candidatus Electrothrix sp. ATG1]|nr:two-component sensor histidine kinase [Candidatus Electrothrix sp. ATG1]
LQQLFSNLIKNTLRYTDKGGQLRITCCRHKSRQKAVAEIRFEDSAPGVAADDLPRLFDRSTRKKYY